MTRRQALIAIFLLLATLTVAGCRRAEQDAPAQVDPIVTAEPAAELAAPTPVAAVPEPAATPAPQAIGAGETVQDTIDAPTDRHRYSFAGQVGDEVRVSVTAITSGFDPSLVVYRPDGSRLCSAGDTRVASGTCHVDVDGDHLIEVGDWFDNDTGRYEIYLQSLNGPDEIKPLPFNTPVEGRLDRPVALDVYTFPGRAGETISVGAQGSDAFRPWFLVLRPDGSRLCWTRELRARRVICTLDTDGDHTVRLGDWFADDTGAYTLFLQSLDDPAAALPVNYDEPVTGSIDLPMQLISYRFEGRGGDELRISAGADSPTFDPSFELRDPQGREVCAESDTRVAHAACVLPLEGTYTLRIGDWFANDTGTFTLELQTLHDAAAYVPLPDQTAFVEAISRSGELDLYRFDGRGGDEVTIEVGVRSGDLVPALAVLRPDGTTLCGASGEPAAVVTCTLDGDGEYRLRLGDNFARGQGDYALALARRPAPDTSLEGTGTVSLNLLLHGTAAGGQAPEGWTVADYAALIFGQLYDPWQVDGYAFYGAAGDVIRASMSRQEGELNPWLRISDPSGSPLCSRRATPVAVVDCTLTATGWHTLQAADLEQDGTGSYRLYLQRLNDTLQFTPLKSGELVQETLDLAVAVDLYRFSARPGDTVQITVSRRTGGMDPEWIVLRPDGTRLCRAWDTAVASDRCRLDSAGPFTLRVGDLYADDAGSYELYLQQLNDESTYEPLVYGTTVSSKLPLPMAFNLYVFEGRAGDRVRFSLTGTAAGLDPLLTVLRPDGSRLCGAGSAREASIICSLDASGRFVVRVGDLYADEAGEYELQLEKLN